MTEIKLPFNEQKTKVIESLKSAGFIDKLKAQLRSEVVRQLEYEKKQQLGSAAKYIKPLSLTQTREVVGREDGLLCAELIREFLTFYKMEHTLSVFIPEMCLHADFPKSREQMERECGMQYEKDDADKPLLLNMVNKVRVGDFAPVSAQKNSPGSEDTSNSPNQMKPHFSANNTNQQQDGMFVDQTPPATGI